MMSKTCLVIHQFSEYRASTNINLHDNIIKHQGPAGRRFNPVSSHSSSANFTQRDPVCLSSSPMECVGRALGVSYTPPSAPWMHHPNTVGPPHVLVKINALSLPHTTGPGGLDVPLGIPSPEGSPKHLQYSFRAEGEAGFLYRTMLG